MYTKSTHTTRVYKQSGSCDPECKLSQVQKTHICNRSKT